MKLQIKAYYILEMRKYLTIHKLCRVLQPIKNRKLKMCVTQEKREIYNNGPVQAFLNVSHDFFHYKSGIYHKTMDPPSGELMTHSVMILGWGEEKGKKFWIGRNSWGEFDPQSDSHWGECKGKISNIENQKPSS